MAEAGPKEAAKLISIAGGEVIGATASKNCLPN